MSTERPFVEFDVVPGRGAASGQREYQEIGGSIKAQKPLFKRAGVDLDAMHNGTINLDIAPFMMTVKRPAFSVQDVQWLDNFPGEDFDFMDAELFVSGQFVPCLIYYPRPETKTAYTNVVPANIVEVIAPFIEGIQYGTCGRLYFDPSQVEMIPSGDTRSVRKTFSRARF